MKLAALAVLAFAGAAQAQIAVADLGTGAPPATLGGFNMLAFGDDTRAVIGDVNDITTADGAPFGTLGFGATVSHREIGFGWATWSHGYTGDVYFVGNSVTMNLPAATGAFYFYAEPDPFGVFNITATANDGTTLTLGVEGNAGANGWGFWSTGGSLTSITVNSDVGFAVGEFGIARIPAPGAAALLGLGGLVATRRRR